MTSKTTDKQTHTNRCDQKKVKAGSVFSRHSHGVVLGFDVHPVQGKYAKLRNSTGFEWQVGITVLEAEFAFADQHDSEETLSRTKVIETIKDSPGTAMTIVYNKKPNAKAGAKDLKAGQGSLSDKEWEKKVEAAQTGAERTIIGHHSLHFDEHQRLRFVEQVNAKSGAPESRLVDLRTVKSVIVNRIKYTVK